MPIHAQMEPSTPSDDTAQLGDPFAVDLYDDASDERFDRITRLACRALDAPIALVSLIDADRQWFCSSRGIDVDETTSGGAFFASAIAQPGLLMIVEDARLDPRFADDPLVDDEPHVRFYAGAAIRAHDGQRIGTLSVLDPRVRNLDSQDRQVLRDLADLVEREVLHVSLALSDSLTGLANRRAFLATANRLVPLAARRGEPLTVLCADLDRLKAVNDTLGHSEGDSLLQRAAIAISSAVRTSDTVARIGGDEFAVLLYGADDDAARTVVDNIKLAIATDNLDESHNSKLSISVGLACASAGESVSEIVTRADFAMYQEKRKLPRSPDGGHAEH